MHSFHTTVGPLSPNRQSTSGIKPLPSPLYGQTNLQYNPLATPKTPKVSHDPLALRPASSVQRPKTATVRRHGLTRPNNNAITAGLLSADYGSSSSPSRADMLQQWTKEKHHRQAGNPVAHFTEYPADHPDIYAGTPSSLYDTPQHHPSHHAHFSPHTAPAGSFHSPSSSPMFGTPRSARAGGGGTELMHFPAFDETGTPTRRQMQQYTMQRPPHLSPQGSVMSGSSDAFSPSLSRQHSQSTLASPLPSPPPEESLFVIRSRPASAVSALRPAKADSVVSPLYPTTVVPPISLNNLLASSSGHSRTGHLVSAGSGNSAQRRGEREWFDDLVRRVADERSGLPRNEDEFWGGWMARTLHVHDHGQRSVDARSMSLHEQSVHLHRLLRTHTSFRALLAPKHITPAHTLLSVLSPEVTLAEAAALLLHAPLPLVIESLEGFVSTRRRFDSAMDLEVGVQGAAQIALQQWRRSWIKRTEGEVHQAVIAREAKQWEQFREEVIRPFVEDLRERERMEEQLRKEQINQALPRSFITPKSVQQPEAHAVEVHSSQDRRPTIPDPAYDLGPEESSYRTRAFTSGLPIRDRESNSLAIPVQEDRLFLQHALRSPTRLLRTQQEEKEESTEILLGTNEPQPSIHTHQQQRAADAVGALYHDEQHHRYTMKQRALEEQLRELKGQIYVRPASARVHRSNGPPQVAQQQAHVKRASTASLSDDTPLFFGVPRPQTVSERRRRSMVNFYPTLAGEGHEQLWKEQAQEQARKMIEKTETEAEEEDGDRQREELVNANLEASDEGETDQPERGYSDDAVALDPEAEQLLDELFEPEEMFAILTSSNVADSIQDRATKEEPVLSIHVSKKSFSLSSPAASSTVEQQSSDIVVEPQDHSHPTPPMKQSVPPPHPLPAGPITVPKRLRPATTTSAVARPKGLETSDLEISRLPLTSPEMRDLLDGVEALQTPLTSPQAAGGHSTIVVQKRKKLQPQQPMEEKQSNVAEEALSKRSSGRATLSIPAAGIAIEPIPAISSQPEVDVDPDEPLDVSELMSPLATKEPQSVPSSTVDESADAEVLAAATKIQASFRGHKVRVELKQRKVTGVVATNVQPEAVIPAAAPTPTPASDEIKAATKIQASFRGHKVRLQVKNKKDAKSVKGVNENHAETIGVAGVEKSPVDVSPIPAVVDAPSSASASFSAAAATPSDESRAAIKIQSRYRGHAVRKATKATNAPTKTIPSIDHVEKSNQSGHQAENEPGLIASKNLDEADSKLQPTGEQEHAKTTPSEAAQSVSSASIPSTAAASSSTGAVSTSLDESGAAVKIQSSFRGHKVRQETRARKAAASKPPQTDVITQNETQEIESQASQSTDEPAAPVGSSVAPQPSSMPLAVEVLSSSSSLPSTMKDESHAAIKIQSSFRGHYARKQIRQKKQPGKETSTTNDASGPSTIPVDATAGVNSKSDGNENEVAGNSLDSQPVVTQPDLSNNPSVAITNVAASSSSDISTGDESHAAIKIQSSFRGHKARKQVIQLRKDGKETTEATLSIEAAAASDSASTSLPASAPVSTFSV